MEHQKSSTLLQAGRRVTRYQCKLVRRILPFLDLPAEIRNMIYELVLGYSGIKDYFDRLHEYLMSSIKDHRPRKPIARQRTLTVLLLNKQIYAEASDLLMKRGVTFHHGLLTTSTVSEVINPRLLQQVSSIHITDVGHPIIKGRILPESWNGYMRLLEQLGNLLTQGHNLKNLTIKFGDARLREHMTDCVATGHDCGFRDQMRKAINHLRRVHNVQKVTLIGIIPEQALDMQDRMQKPAIGFEDLPRELRDVIWRETVDWPDLSTALVRAMANWPDQRVRFPYPSRSTPKALLLNKQYSSEALQVLRKKPLNITFPGHHNINEQEKVPKIMRFISRQALKNVESININMESWDWVYSINKSLANALATSPYLRKFRLDYRDSLKPSFLTVSNQYYPDNKLHLCLRELKHIRGLEQAIFDGDLPVCYTDALATIMMSDRYTREQLPELKAINVKGEMLIIDDKNEDQARIRHPSSSTSRQPRRAAPT
ncbi:hypothetical protein DOTSEDRAFT_69689 [Dothistroma septosporum NZE10]|uniref:F-box domain-containing protein n=1 Tax=Dothistroma septosporum (strain NZE10 / CBS 128990) TaxID=675120 RepID=N1Q032_DOTSN|nr:hypothetical protein DOTSEDRAFT_69689 [Dothistroma septosporum NZE10]